MIIDFSSRPPLPQFAGAAPHLANYRRVYAASEKQVREESGEDALASYLAAYEAVNARHVVLKARDLETTFGFRIANEDVAAFCAQNAPRFLGFAGVDPHKGMQAVRELEVAVRDLGLIGLNLQCFEHRLPINDRKLYPLYAKCIELDIPVNIHCGANFSRESVIDYGRPTLLDEVLVHFPELRVCASPPGWPWVHELVSMAWRHPNLWIGLVAVSPKLLARPGTGYEALLTYGSRVLSDRIIFGSAFPMMPVVRAVAEVEALPLDDHMRRKWLHDNAVDFLRLGEGSVGQ